MAMSVVRVVVATPTMLPGKASRPAFVPGGWALLTFRGTMYASTRPCGDAALPSNTRELGRRETCATTLLPGMVVAVATPATVGFSVFGLAPTSTMSAGVDPAIGTNTEREVGSRR
ncbi:hypothetical protein ACFL59_04640 [Planctomycetota bacterium]